MAYAIDVARYLVLLADAEDEPEILSHLRLQKLLYYVQAWSFALRGKAVFSEPIQAWPHGPVVPAVYHAFREFGKRPITASDVEGHEIELDDDDRAFVLSVWDSLKGHSALSLRRMTHEEAPWVDARRGYGPADRCESEITPEAMRAFFADRVEP